MAKAGAVSVLIPTMNRAESLARALRSVFAQDRAELICEIIVIDNAPDASARATVEALRPASPAPLVYLHALPPGASPGSQPPMSPFWTTTRKRRPPGSAPWRPCIGRRARTSPSARFRARPPPRRRGSDPISNGSSPGAARLRPA